MTHSFFHYFEENSTEDYMIAGVYFLATFVLFFILEKIILGRLLSDSDKKESGVRQRLEAVGKSVEKFLSFPLVLIFAIYIATSGLILPPMIENTISLVILFTAAYYLLQAAFTFLDYTILFTKQKTGEEHIVNFMKFILRTVILVLVALWFLSELGIDITTFLAGFGILGLGFAFALQNVLGDLFASITIYLDRPFEIGDNIKIGTDLGVVEKIGLKSTHMRTPLGNLLIVSNRELTNQRIHNMKRMDTRRVEMIVGVSYDTPIEKLEMIPEWVKEIVESFDETKFNWTYFTEMAASSLNYKIVYQITTSDAMVWLKTQQSVNLSILKKFQDEDIDIPYPVQKVLVENI